MIKKLAMVTHCQSKRVKNIRWIRFNDSI